MRNFTLVVCLLAVSSIAVADPLVVYERTQANGRNQLNGTAYEICIRKFTRAIQPRGLGLSMTYYAGGSLKADQRVLYINGSYFKDSERVSVGIDCKTNYRSESVTGLKATIGAHYAVHEGATSPELLADE